MASHAVNLERRNSRHGPIRPRSRQSCLGRGSASETGLNLIVASVRAEVDARWRGRGTAGLENAARSRRAQLPTTDAPFAQKVEQKMSNLLAGLERRAAFPERPK